MEKDSGSAHEEIWLPVVGYEGRYDVSNMGRLRAHIWKGGRPLAEPRIIVQTPTHDGYLRVRLTHSDGFSRHLVSRLVLIAFRGEAPGMTASHLNNVRTDNRLLNLVWESIQSNVARKKIFGTTARGERHFRRKLLERDVLDIKSRLAQGERICRLGREYGVSSCAIGDIDKGRSWGWLTSGRGQ